MHYFHKCNHKWEADGDTRMFVGFFINTGFQVIGYK